MSKKLNMPYFQKSTEFIARDLLGKTLCRRIDDNIVKTKIVETEAYFGEDDPASHARFGKTDNNYLMYDIGGKIHIYLIYGIYHLLNFTTEVKDNAGAVLIRAVEPLENVELMYRYRNKKGIILSNGPGKLTKALSIDMKLNALTVENDLLYIENSNNEKMKIESGKRIGIKKDFIQNYRFYIKGNKYVSK